MKLPIVLASLLSLQSTAGFSSVGTSQQSTRTELFALSARNLPGIVAPLGFFDPLGFAASADENTLKRYREAEITHGRVGMLAVVGFLAGEQVAGSTPIFGGSVTGPAISHLPQCPPPFWIGLLFFVSYVEFVRAQVGWVEPDNVPFDQAGLLRPNYSPGDLGFDPLGLKPTNPAELKDMQTRELQNGRLAMLAAAGCMAQELVDGKGIIEHLQSS